MDIATYLPDELGARAKDADLPFSRLLRAAVEVELARRAAIADLLSNGIEEHEVELEDVTGVIVGKLLGETDGGDAIYLTDDERLLWYSSRTEKVEPIDAENLAEWLQSTPRDTEAIADVMRQLGLRPRVRL